MIEAPLRGARAIFTTRSGGASEEPYASRNLGLFTDDHEPTVRANLDELAEAFGHQGFQLLKQVHGEIIESVGGRTLGEVPIADGAVTTERLHPILITGADCPTAFLSDGDQLVALHCGWRPVAGGIIEAGAALFNKPFDAVVGPGICQGHFEVGPEVVDALGEDGAKAADGRQLDLVAVIRARLSRSGAELIHVVDRCTYCEPDVFFSHRRDGGVTGRQAGIAWLS